MTWLRFFYTRGVDNIARLSQESCGDKVNTYMGIVQKDIARPKHEDHREEIPLSLE